MPNNFLQRVKQWTHTSLRSGHPRISKTLQITQNSFWWPLVNRDLTRFVNYKTPRELSSGLLEPLAISQRPWSHISIDFKDLPLSNEFTTIMVIIDRLSKSCRLILMKGLPTAKETALALFQHVLSLTVSHQGTIHNQMAK